ncbi:MAG: PhzF family phenazine biosynthesis protein [Vampirovibrionales bacterium]|nr:PhzF family phenazine biosynthesis protein [Vampirovibrionales bacterium]
MRLSFKQVDAFSADAFKGNPAAVFVSSEPLPDILMQDIAMEMNLSETAFLVPQQEENHYSLRWFTPKAEVDLCGHATLASAHALWEDQFVAQNATIVFHSKSGLLHVGSQDGWIQMDFPLEGQTDVATFEEEALLKKALGISLSSVVRNRLDFLVELESASDLARVAPDFNMLKQLNARGVIVTAFSDNPSYDFMSRGFFPAVGIDEDPVTGSAHCFLADYWHRKLKKTNFTAYQGACRGGVLKLSLLPEDRVLLCGQAVTTVRGELSI